MTTTINDIVALKSITVFRVHMNSLPSTRDEAQNQVRRLTQLREYLRAQQWERFDTDKASLISAISDRINKIHRVYL